MTSRDNICDSFTWVCIFAHSFEILMGKLCEWWSFQKSEFHMHRWVTCNFHAAREEQMEILWNLVWLLSLTLYVSHLFPFPKRIYDPIYEVTFKDLKCLFKKVPLPHRSTKIPHILKENPKSKSRGKQHS